MHGIAWRGIVVRSLLHRYVCSGIGARCCTTRPLAGLTRLRVKASHSSATSSYRRVPFAGSLIKMLPTGTDATGRTSPRGLLKGRPQNAEEDPHCILACSGALLALGRRTKHYITLLFDGYSLDRYYGDFFYPGAGAVDPFSEVNCTCTLTHISASEESCMDWK
jgi:hypothetical protein